MNSLAAKPLRLVACLCVSAATLPACGSERPLLHEHAPFQQALRPDNDSSVGLFRFADTDTVVWYDSPSGGFRVHYTEAGDNAVPALDIEPNGEPNGVPDFVEQVADVYDEVLTLYTDVLGFSPPLSDVDIVDNGGDGRFDVYLVDFGLSADGAFQIDACSATNPDTCIGYMVQENDFAGYWYPNTLVANRTLGSHEFFHAVQAAYDVGQDPLFSEGSAVWATEVFDPSLRDFEWFIGAFLDSPDRSLNLPMGGVVDPHNYGAGLFFWFLYERYGNDAVLRLWEACINGSDDTADPEWFDALPRLLGQQYDVQFAEVMVEFATWNLFTGNYADPARAYANGAGYPLVQFEVEAADVAALPFSKESLRLYPAATRYFAVPVEGATEMTAALVGPDSALADLSMLLVPRNDSGNIEVLELADIRHGVITVDTSTATTLAVAVVNTASEGNSRRPALCIGTVAQVEACHKAIDPTFVPIPPEPEPEQGSGGKIEEGCRCSGSSGSSVMLGWLLLLWLATRFRFRRSPTSR